MEPITQRAFAELHGVSRQTVNKWKRRGWLVFAGDLVNVEESNARIKKYRRDGINVTEGGKRYPVTVKPKPEETTTEAAVRILTAHGAYMDIDEARRVKENYLALLNQLEYDVKSGLVVEIAGTVQAVGAAYARVRTRMLAIPAEQAPRIHMLKTAAEVQEVLRAAVSEALEELVTV